ncbi:DUF6907 domain-containing protein [Streptomyces hirsutus]|uniref:DUF6907 domain-containing protein n=1 Tax=Streptomyces hirsutus TaxID=35620 RepID=UPI00369F9A37
MNTATEPTIMEQSAAPAPASVPAATGKRPSLLSRMDVDPDSLVVVDGKLTEAGEALVTELAAELSPLINRAPDPAAALAEFERLFQEGLEGIAAARSTAEDRCTVHGWCVETGYHFDHNSADHVVTSLSREEPLIYAHLLHLSTSKPFIGLQGEDLDADQARAKAAELRKLADSIDEMVGLLTEDSATAEPGHWPWCRPHECITHQYDDGETYIEHYGHKATAVMTDTDGSDAVRLHACLGFDESTAKEHPDVFLEDPDGPCVFLDVTSLDATITQLSDFTNTLRAMRRQMTKPPVEGPAGQERGERDIERMAATSGPRLEVPA